RIWMHNGLLKLKDKDGKEAKMAGSLGNVLNVCDALRHVSGDVLRFFLLQTHYRSQVDLGIWDWRNPQTPIPNGLLEARSALRSFYRFFEQYEKITHESFYQLKPLPVGEQPIDVAKIPDDIREEEEYPSSLSARIEN